MVSPGFQRVPPARCTKFIEAPAVSPRPPPSVPRWFGRRLPHRWHRRWLPTFEHIAPDGTGRDLGNNNVPLVKNRGAGSWYTIYHHLAVGGAITILKNMSQWEGLSHILWKKMIETNNQASFKSDGTGRDLGTLGPCIRFWTSSLIYLELILVARFRTEVLNLTGPWDLGTLSKHVDLMTWIWRRERFLIFWNHCDWISLTVIY